ncbi:MAG: hypothetical protein AAF791_04340 [Bacteroidota bacterium]
MKTSDWTFLALNAFLLLFSFVGVASTDTDTLIVGAMLAMVVAAANGIRIVRNRETRTPREATRRRSRANEMDARTILELDERLEALERREREVEEAERIRRMMDRGEQTAPAEAHSSPLGTEADRIRS